MGLIKQCGRFCYWLGHCAHQHAGNCMGYAEPENDEEEIENKLERTTY